MGPGSAQGLRFYTCELRPYTGGPRNYTDGLRLRNYTDGTRNYTGGTRNYIDGPLFYTGRLQIFTDGPLLHTGGPRIYTGASPESTKRGQLYTGGSTITLKGLTLLRRARILQIRVPHYFTKGDFSFASFTSLYLEEASKEGRGVVTYTSTSTTFNQWVYEVKHM